MSFIKCFTPIKPASWPIATLIRMAAMI